jgi:predicted ester cyclase
MPNVRFRGDSCRSFICAQAVRRVMKYMRESLLIEPLVMTDTTHCVPVMMLLVLIACTLSLSRCLSCVVIASNWLRSTVVVRIYTQQLSPVPDVYFEVRTLIASPPLVASRLVFNCAPADRFLGLPVRGKRISYSENAFYLFDGEKIGQIWSVMDKMAIEAQL